jgi:hypothetical protein
MSYQTTEDFCKAQLEAAGLPVTAETLRAVSAEERPEIETRVKNLAASLADPKEAARAARLEELRGQYKAAMAAGRVDLALSLKSQMQAASL